MTSDENMIISPNIDESRCFFSPKVMRPDVPYETSVKLHGNSIARRQRKSRTKPKAKTKMAENDREALAMNVYSVVLFVHPVITH